MRKKILLGLLGMTFMLGSCVKDQNDNQLSNEKLSGNVDFEFESIVESNLDLPIGTEISVMANSDIIIGEIADDGNIKLFKTKFIKNYIDADDNEYLIEFNSLSKDLKVGDIHYAQYVYTNINDADDQKSIITMLDFKFPDGTWNNDLHDCGKLDINELRSGGVAITHSCESIRNFPNGCSSCVIKLHACGEFFRCECRSGGLGYCVHTVTYTTNHLGLGGANMFGLSYIYANL